MITAGIILIYFSIYMISTMIDVWLSPDSRLWKLWISFLNATLAIITILSLLLLVLIGILLVIGK